MFKKFIRDPYFLLKYALANLVILGVACLIVQWQFNQVQKFQLIWFWIVGLILFVLPHFILIFFSGVYFVWLFMYAQNTSITFLEISLIPFGILCGTFSAALMHNSAHQSIYPKWSNRLIGEICGLFQVTGFAGWYIAHMLHHSNPDHPEKDPHHPGKLSFVQFANAMGFMMKEALTKKYFELMGKTKATEIAWSAIVFLSPITRYARVLFLMLILGPTFFIFFYVPFKIANALIYIDFNYRTHRPNKEGVFEVLNLNHNFWYKLLNLISFGSYFHKNHHKNPSLFNPKHNVREKGQGQDKKQNSRFFVG